MPAKNSPLSASVGTRRKSSRNVATASLPDEPNVAPVASMAQAQAALSNYGGGWGSGQGYSMADASSARGWIYFPTLDTKKEVTTYTRTEGLRKARFLDANVGLAGRLLRGMGRMAMGTGLMPGAKTREPWWNKIVDRRMAIVLGSPLTYDLAGKQDYYSGQADDVSTGFRDGDLGKVYARDEGGNLRSAYYEGHQIGGTLQNEKNPTSIFDGVRVDRHNKSVGFIIQSGEQAGQAVEIPAADFAFLCNYGRKGSSRGVTILKHAINKMVDRGQLEAMTAKGMMNAARIGYALTRDASAPPKPPGWSGTGVNPVRKETITKTDGTTTRIKIEDVIDPSGGEVPELPAGMDIKMLMDTRPHPNTMEFFDYIARDAAMGCDWPHELLYNIWKLGGANMRYVMADAQSIIEREQYRWIGQFGTRDYIAFLAEEMRTGRVPKCPDPEWWAHEFIPPARMTVDFGRDGALNLEQIKCGALTFKRYFGWQGLGMNQLDEWMDEVAGVVQGCTDRKFSPEITTLVLDGLYRRSGVAASPPMENPTAKPTDDKTKE